MTEGIAMLRIFVVAVSLAICSAADAQSVTLAEVKAKSGVQLSADDLKQLMPGATVVSPLSTGGTRRWTNKAEGTFIASTDGRSISGGRNLPAQGKGSWHFADNGTYCVNINWGRLTEDWCYYIFKAGAKYYGVRRLEDEAPANELEISR
jgi:hypothetical protein